MDADGSNLKQLANGQSDGAAVCSPGSKFVCYFDGQTSQWVRIPLEGGTAEAIELPLPKGAGKFPITGISPNDRLLVTFTSIPDPATNTYKKKILIFKTDSSGDTISVLDADPRINVTHGGFPHFSPDGQALVYTVTSENNADNVWLQPLDRKPGYQITQFTSDRIFGFGWSPDGKKLAVGRGHVESDVVLLRDTTK